MAVAVPSAPLITSSDVNDAASCIETGENRSPAFAPFSQKLHAANLVSVGHTRNSACSGRHKDGVQCGI